MSLAQAPLASPCTLVRGPPVLHRPRTLGWTPLVEDLRSRRPAVQCTAASSSDAAQGIDIEASKQKLRVLVASTRRGSKASSEDRGEIEEAQVDVESCAPAELDYTKLEGLWRLVYTSAADVLPILALEPEPVPWLPFAPPPPVTVGDIYQRFSSPEEGAVDNVIKLSVPFFLEEKEGLTFEVGARYVVRTGHRIALTFEEAAVKDVKISDTLETLIAPSLLPRSSLNHQVLLGIKDFKYTVPLATPSAIAANVGRSVGANYQLTYLDDDILIGRAPQGVFIFERAQEE